jgi:predicted nucleic-acid-binding Zn-ribbon protein
LIGPGKNDWMKHGENIEKFLVYLLIFYLLMSKKCSYTTFMGAKVFTTNFMGDIRAQPVC